MIVMIKEIIMITTTAAVLTNPPQDQSHRRDVGPDGERASGRRRGVLARPRRPLRSPGRAPQDLLAEAQRRHGPGGEAPLQEGHRSIQVR